MNHNHLIEGPAMDGSIASARHAFSTATPASVHVLQLDEDAPVSQLPLREIASGAVVASLLPGQLRPLAARLRAAGRVPSTPIVVLTDPCARRPGRYETTLADPHLPGVAGLERRLLVVIGDVAPAPVAADEAVDGLGFSMAGIAG